MPEDIDAEPQIDRAAELQRKWDTRAGQLWLIGSHRLLCGDSTKREDVERVMGGEKPLLMVTDPPYGVDSDPTWRAEAGIVWAKDRMALGRGDYHWQHEPIWYAVRDGRPPLATCRGISRKRYFAAE